MFAVPDAQQRGGRVDPGGGQGAGANRHFDCRARGLLRPRRCVIRHILYSFICAAPRSGLAWKHHIDVGGTCTQLVAGH